MMYHQNTPWPNNVHMHQRLKMSPKPTEHIASIHTPESSSGIRISFKTYHRLPVQNMNIYMTGVKGLIMLLCCIKVLNFSTGLDFFLFAFISFTFQGGIRYRSFCSERTPGAL